MSNEEAAEKKHLFLSVSLQASAKICFLNFKSSIETIYQMRRHEAQQILTET